MSNILSNYQEFVKKTTRFDFGLYQLLYMSNGLGGETGELQNEVKKIYREIYKGKKEKPDCNNEVLAELGDILWYTAAICNELDIKLEDVITNNIDKLSNKL